MQRTDTRIHDPQRPTDEFSPQAMMGESAQSQPCLVQLSGVGTGRLFYLPTREGAIQIGRLETADLCLAYPEIAPEQARIFVEAGEMFLENLHRPQSLRVQGQPIVERHRLQHGDRLQVGPYLAFKYLRLKEDEIACQEQIYRSSSHDPLTQLANARHFQDLLEQEWSYAKRHKHPLSILCLDIDHFRQYNEMWGFSQGDRLLGQYSERLQQSLRREDTLARVGADGFAILLRGTPHEGALHVAERIRQTAKQLTMPTGSTPFCLTVSIGMLSTIPHPAHLPLSLLQSAHEQLHHAQQQGGDQIAFEIPSLTALNAEIC